MMPLSPSPPSSSKRPAPMGLPSNLMDDFVPVSPAFAPQEEEDGWGQVSTHEVDDEDGEEEDYEGRSGGLVDLDAVAREEADVWGGEGGLRNSYGRVE
jgi:hypothetical protein